MNVLTKEIKYPVHIWRLIFYRRRLFHFVLDIGALWNMSKRNNIAFNEVNKFITNPSGKGAGELFYSCAIRWNELNYTIPKYDKKGLIDGMGQMSDEENKEFSERVKSLFDEAIRELKPMSKKKVNRSPGRK